MSALELLGAMREVAVAAESDTAAGNRIIAAFLAKLPKQPADMIRLFDRGSYYTLHGRDAHTVAAEYFKSSAAVKYTAGASADEKQPYLTFNKTMGSEVIRAALLEQRRRVEVYASSGSTWALARKGSPGNLQAFEDECMSRDSDLSADTSPVIAAVRLGRAAAGGGGASSSKKGGGGGGGAMLVGVAFIDCQVRSIRVSEFEDDAHLSTLESLLCQQGARECLIPNELHDHEKAAMRDVLELCEVPQTVAKKGAFAARDAAHDVKRLVGKSEAHSRAFTSKEQLALSAACGLLQYLELVTNPTSKATHGLWSMDWVDAAQYMRLDAGAMRALSVEPQPQDKDKNASLLGLFNVCKTAMGSRLVRKWLKQPLLSRVDLEERYDLVEAFVSGYETRSTLRDEVLPRLGADLDKLGRAFAAKKAGLKEVVHLYFFVLNLPKLLSALRAHDESASSEEEASLMRQKFTAPLEAVYTNFTNLVRLVQAAVDLAAANRHEYALQPHFSDALAALDEQREEVRASIEEHYESLCDLIGDKDRSKMHLECDQRYGYCLRVSRKDEKDLRECSAVKKGSLRLDQLMTKKEGVFVRDSHLASYAEEYTQISRKYDAEQRGLVAKVVETAATFAPVIAECHGLLAELDVLLSFAHVSSSAPEPYVRPTLVLPEDPKQRIVLRGCRHPCVERMEGVSSFIKNDVELVRGESAMQVVTGPNMGGKSTYIRSAGVAVLMAQIGCFVPCEEAEISLADSILARVGAGDCQSRGVSTFMAEMLETATILKGASPSSLVIIDELGRGTSTYDGFGLAWAIAEHLVTSVGCCTLFATHFHELTAMAQTRPQVRNRHVAAHLEEGSMTMLYRVEDGPCDKAFGIHVAEVAKFPADVVAGAKRKLGELEASDDVLPPSATTADSSVHVHGGRARSALTAEERAAAVGEVQSFLSAFRALPLDGLEEGAAREEVQRVARETLEASSNPLARSLVHAA